MRDFLSVFRSAQDKVKILSAFKFASNPTNFFSNLLANDQKMTHVIDTTKQVRAKIWLKEWVNTASFFIYIIFV